MCDSGQAKGSHGCLSQGVLVVEKAALCVSHCHAAEAVAVHGTSRDKSAARATSILLADEPSCKSVLPAFRSSSSTQPGGAST